MTPKKMDRAGCNILALKTVSGYDLLAWSSGEISKRDARRLSKKFRHDEDVVCPVVFDWCRFYDNKADMRRDLPEV